MRDPNKLMVTEQATTLAVEVYRLTSDFPSSERFGLAAQMRRAAVSVGSNIAEGCGRSGDRDFVRFLQIARGSTTELAFQLSVAMELGLGRSTEQARVAETIDHLQRMLNRLTASMRKKGSAPRRGERATTPQPE
ncbi:MAG TPA: four helix bundle protein [Gemmatimonadaceae bacterium]|nr:four helix bundle protein [Gemmatimonadaceae bacterium]